MSALGRLLRSRRTRWVIGLLLAASLVTSAVLVVLGSVNRRQADDPRSNIRSGAGALGQLLADEGVEIITTDEVDDAIARLGADATLVVANGNRLDEASARRLLAGGAARVILLRPNTLTLRAFGVRATGQPAQDGLFEPECPVEAARRAGPVRLDDLRASYRADGPADFACYPTGSGHAYLGVRTAEGVPVELVGGGIANSVLDAQGNAAFAMNVFGSSPNLVWLMSPTVTPRGDATRTPTLLPAWWQMAMVQFFVAFVVAAIWRGRRLGPIMTEPLPVTVRASETVEGHGRLYSRLNARDRAAESLRTGSRARLSRAYGHADDPLALSAAVASRTGRDPAKVRALLYDAMPNTDDDLVDLARDLDRLEQEARRL